MENSHFFSVPLNSYSSTACSPVFADRSETGLRITAPAEIDLAHHAVFPLCGTMRLQARFLAGLNGDPIEATVVVVVNKTENTPLSFNLKPDKDPVKDDDPAQASDPNEFDEDDVRENYFNVDLRTFSPQLDSNLVPGDYAVYAVMDMFKSNTVEVRVLHSSRDSR